MDKTKVHKHCGGRVVWEVYMKCYVCEKCGRSVHFKYIEWKEKDKPVPAPAKGSEGDGMAQRKIQRIRYTGI